MYIIYFLQVVLCPKLECGRAAIVSIDFETTPWLGIHQASYIYSRRLSRLIAISQYINCLAA